MPIVRTPARPPASTCSARGCFENLVKPCIVARWSRDRKRETATKIVRNRHRRLGSDDTARRLSRTTSSPLRAAAIGQATAPHSTAHEPCLANPGASGQASSGCAMFGCVMPCASLNQVAMAGSGPQPPQETHVGPIGRAELATAPMVIDGTTHQRACAPPQVSRYD